MRVEGSKLLIFNNYLRNILMILYNSRVILGNNRNEVLIHFLKSEICRILFMNGMLYT